MKALQVIEPRHFTQVQAVMPDLKSSDADRILVQTQWVSMCGSDIPYFTGSKRHKSYPLAPGMPIHECIGQVVESTSDQFQSGKWVISIPECDKGLAEFFVAQAAKAVSLPRELAARDTSCLIQPLSTVLNAVDRLGDIEGRSVAVIGLGSIGLFFCWLLKKRGVERIIGIDPCANRCQLAERMGATRIFQMRSIEVVHAARQDSTDWEPPDICIEAVGHQMDTLNDCFELVKKRGTILAFGVPDHLVYAIEFETFFRKNAHLISAVTPEWSEYLAKARDLFLSFHQELELFVTHRFSIVDAQEAFTLYERHDQGIIKAVLDASNWENK
jgi:L-iditol 2-dehydrogenase